MMLSALVRNDSRFAGNLARLCGLNAFMYSAVHVSVIFVLSVDKLFASLIRAAARWSFETDLQAENPINKRASRIVWAILIVSAPQPQNNSQTAAETRI